VLVGIYLSTCGSASHIIPATPSNTVSTYSQHAHNWAMSNNQGGASKKSELVCCSIAIGLWKVPVRVQLYYAHDCITLSRHNTQHKKPWHAVMVLAKLGIVCVWCGVLVCWCT
jgi:hypothetical protein